MELITLEQFKQQTAAYDHAVASTPAIDRFCSSSTWIVPAHASFHGQAETLILRSEHGWLALARGEAFGLGRFLSPLEAMWGLASPVVGADPKKLARDVVQALGDRRDQWDALWLGGLVRDGVLFREMVARLGRHVSSNLRLGPTALRWTASLEGGLDGWLERRSAKFRGNLRQALKKADAAGLTLEWFDDVCVEARALALYDRIVAIEHTSWKGREGSGFVGADMQGFYRRMLPRLAALGRLRVLVARIDGADAAFLFGGIFEGTFRGLQVSFDDRYRHLSLGNVMQAHAIARLAREGVGVYDLGSDMEYKARWAERGLETVTLVAFAR